MNRRAIRAEDLQGQPGLSRKAIEQLLRDQPATVREALKIKGVGRKTTRRLLKLGLILDPDATQTGGQDPRVEVQQLFSNLKAALPQLRKLLDECSSHWGYEDPVYRFYHQSFKVYWLQETTTGIVSALQTLAPDRPLNAWFAQIVKEGTGLQFEPDHNKRWTETTRPILEAFFHARYFLEMAARYGKTLKAPPVLLPSGWAALLYLYNLR
jgi:hypothetical protein